MKKVLLSLFVFACFFSLSRSISETVHASSTEQTTANYETVINYAKQYRTDTTLSSSEEKEKKKNIRQIVYPHLSTYTSDTLENGVWSFLQETLSLNKADFILIDVRSTKFFGESDAAVFLIKDKSGELRYVVKAFNDLNMETTRYLHEISSIDLIKELKLPGVLPVNQLAFGLCRENGTEWGLLLETAAKGKRLDQYITDIKDADNVSENRKYRFETAKTAISHLGASLARLHQSRTSAPGPIPDSYLEKMNIKLNQVLKTPFIIDELSKHISIVDFVNYIEQVKYTALLNTLNYSFIHGDAHLGNIFFDLETNTCTFIDLCCLHESINIHGQPLMHGVIDCVLAVDSIRFKSSNILTTEEINELINAFYMGYEKSGGEIPDASIYNYYDTYIKLRRLLSKSFYSTNADPRIQASDQMIFEDAIRYFEEHILRI